MFIFDSAYIWLVLIPSLVLSVGAQLYVSSAYKKWGNTRNSMGLTGVQAGERIKRAAGLQSVNFEGVPGELTDHYDPSNHTVRMSQDIATKPSVASLAIVAHELGHAQQHQEKSALIALRSFLVPAMRFSPMAAYVLILLGVFMQVTSFIELGILFFAVVVAFMLLTLPVEVDASRRGMALLRQANLVSDADADGARQILTAAAMTYVAAFLTSLLTLIYYISILRRSN